MSSKKDKIVIYSKIFGALALTGISFTTGCAPTKVNQEQETETEIENETKTNSMSIEDQIDQLFDGSKSELKVEVESKTNLGTTTTKEEKQLKPYEQEFTYENFVETCELFMKNNNIPEEQYEHIAATAMLCNINHVPTEVFQEYLQEKNAVDIIELSNTYIYANVSNSIDRYSAKCTDLSELIFDKKDRESIHAVAETVQNLIKTKQEFVANGSKSALEAYKESLTTAVATYINTVWTTEEQAQNEYHWPFSDSECDYNINYVALKYAICIETHCIDDFSGVYIGPEGPHSSEYGVSAIGIKNEDYTKKIDPRCLGENFDILEAINQVIEYNEQLTVNPLYDTINHLEVQCTSDKTMKLK